jgi:Tfp pilus assembly protein PilP
MAIPDEMVDLEMTVEDGDANWLTLAEHLWLLT